MNETADVASNLPAIILLSFWWAFLSMLDFLSRQGQPAHRPNMGRHAGEARDGGVEDFPELREADPQFSTEAFMRGACRAYEEILRAYALCDTKALQALLSAEVFRAFTDAFEERSAREETLELTFIGVQSAKIVNVEIHPDAIEIAVLFRAQVVQAERSSRGEVVRGDPGEVAVVADLWTFSRSRKNGATTWVVVATDESLEAS